MSLAKGTSNSQCSSGTEALMLSKWHKIEIMQVLCQMTTKRSGNSSLHGWLPKLDEFSWKVDEMLGLKKQLCGRMGWRNNFVCLERRGKDNSTKIKFLILCLYTINLNGVIKLRFLKVELVEKDLYLLQNNHMRTRIRDESEDVLIWEQIHNSGGKESLCWQIIGIYARKIGSNMSSFLKIL